MNIRNLPQALHIVGVELRTSNAEAMQTIPSFWQRFAQEGGAERVRGRLSDDVYAVYTHFAHAGLDNQGLYSLVIGAEVPPEADVPQGMVRVVVPAGRRAVFDVEAGRPDLIGQAWEAVWQHDDLPKSYVADYEHYRCDGGIEILVGLHPAGA